MKQSRRLAAIVRGIRPDRNPLRRTADRVEAVIFGGLIVAAAAGAPAAAISASHWASASAAQASHVTRHTGRLTQAVLLDDPRGPAMTGYAVDGTGAVLARWTTPAGTQRDGVILAPAGSLKGARVPVWTDAAGDLTTPPLSTAQVAAQGSYAAAFAAIGVVFVAIVAGIATRLIADRRRLAGWAADWALTAPTWTRQSW